MWPNRKNSIILTAIILGGFLVRIWGINFGLPQAYHFDEMGISYTAFFAASHGLKPHQFDHPMLLPLILIFLYGGYFLLGLILGFWKSTEQFFVAYLSNPTVFLLLGRFFIALAGIFTVWLVAYVGKKVFRDRIGLIAAFFLAFSFLHVMESHFIKEDILAGLLGLLIFYNSVLLLKKGKTKSYLFSGVLFGLSLALKYYSFIFLPMLILAHYFKQGGKKKFWLMFSSAIVTFFLINPYVIFFPNQALREIVLLVRMHKGSWIDTGGWPTWLYYLTYHLRYGLGEAVLVTVLGGIVYLLIKKREPKSILLISAPLTFFISVAIFGGGNFARYLLPILPLFVLIAAILVDGIFRLFKFRTDFFLLLTCFIFLFSSLLRIIKFDFYLSCSDTRTLSKGWIKTNIPSGSKIVNEGTMQSEYASIYGPPIYMDKKSLMTRLEMVRRVGLPGNYLLALIKAREGKIGYNLKGLFSLDSEYDTVSGKYISILGVEKYLADNYCYLISSSWAKHNQTSYQNNFQKSLEKYYHPIKIFIPKPEFDDDPVAWNVDFKELDKVNIFDSTTIQGPTIKIYKLKDSEGCF